ncbi:MAG: hypothetical protein VXA39_16755, partial [Deltaproteobacteria bacterium]
TKHRLINPNVQEKTFLKLDPLVMQTKFFWSYVMAIAIRHVFEPTEDGVFDPVEHRRLAEDFPAGKLPGVRSVTVYRNIDQQIMVGEAILENKDVLESWENWNNSPE